MLYLDIPPTQLQRDALAAALRGAAAAMTAEEAMSVLSNVAVELPGRDDLLEDAVASSDVADAVRGAALSTLARTAPTRAVTAARNVRDPGEQVVLAALTALGRLGEPSDTGKVAGLADAPETSPVVVSRARFARALIAHRFGLRGQEEPTPLALLSDPGSAGEPFVSTETGATRASVTLAAVRDWAPEVSAESHVVLDITCGKQPTHLVLRRDLLDAQSQKRLLSAPAVLGYVVSPNPQNGTLENGTLGVALLILYQPSANGVALRVTRTTGEPVYAGTMEHTADAGLSADLYAVHRPGAPAGRIRGLVSEKGVEVFGRSTRTAAVPKRVPERRPEGDPSNTFVQPLEQHHDKPPYAEE
ncbi:HEAT repeat domain-containing protein [Streptomyces sp. NPDC006326]|uniref:HEAT repeat domain-containing protein n=1 Tax=Streptomyces sp. NPDC006326 TaxID=3156752 RepID=UPI0033AA1FDD